MIRLAAAKAIPGARFVVSDCFQLSRICRRAGAVVSRGVLLSHYGREQSRDLLVAARKALVPGGFLLFDFLNEEARSSHCHAPEDKTYFIGEHLLDLARGAGFNQAAIQGETQRRVLLLVARAAPGT
jgi:hypothetical protein